MIVYLPHYDNGEDYSDYSHNVSTKAYVRLEDAIQEIKDNGFIIREDKDVSSIVSTGYIGGDVDDKILPFAFYSISLEEYKNRFKYSYFPDDSREFAYINEIELVEGETDA
ncbi:MAG: hypothetical protein E6647_01405 [Staphylococcus epidermidis]|jgi:hypothetical protein|uniref:Uncharacterized protein n=1 Tax=uncultured Caudovirales phage TaxID=2100421 RepID=A0A2H4J415_9CAUD|nr:hypothetical protein 9S3_37 [uncultured Caudovirales phage]MDU6161092.1 hypothetical protein [Staphylococcus epidermidis]USL87151.1 hypothetical protein Sazerac_060 [Staphylococcus phage Sazerac]